METGVGSFISTRRKDDRWVETERPRCRKRKRSAPGTKFHLGSCRSERGKGRRVNCEDESRREYSTLRAVPRRVFSSCISQCHERHRAAARKAKNKPARKHTLMDETSFQPHGALLLPPYFPLLSSTPPLPRRSLVGLRWNNTDHVDLSTSNHI